MISVLEYLTEGSESDALYFDLFDDVGFVF